MELSGTIRYMPIFVLAACLICSPARGEVPVTANAPPPLSEPATGELPPAGPVRPAVSPRSPEPGAPDGSLTGEKNEKSSSIGKTADETHDRLERGILQQVVSLDNFFGKVNSQKEQRSSYLLRWRSSLRLEQENLLQFGSGLRANVDLSRISERLLLTISGAKEPESFAPSLPEDPGNPNSDRTFQNTRIVNSELRYKLFHSPIDDLFLGAGLDLALPFRYFARARYQHILRISEISQVRLTETLFAKTPYGIGETTELSLERVLNPKTLVRLASSGTVSQEIGALEWGSELSLLRELSTRSAVTLIGGVYGNTRLQQGISNYRILTRYRRNFLRSWLFYELEPEVTWPLTAAGSFPPAYAFSFHLEVVFQGEEKKAADRP